MRRWTWCAAAALMVMVAACAPEIALDADLRYANGRAAFRTEAGAIPLVPGDVSAPYDVLGDVEVIVRQRGAFGELPRAEHAEQGLRKQAARLGADAVVLVSFGVEGMSFWTYHELRAHGRAIRYR